MAVTSAVFVSSHTRLSELPATGLPEFVFAGRSNVGKSSLINMLTGRKTLAKTSATPGKTQTINHYLINDQWYLVDLPGYGYAKTSHQAKAGFSRLIRDYLTGRKQIACVFILVDVRHEPLQNDLAAINNVGRMGIPLAIIFTKADKLSRNQLKVNINNYEQRLLETWERLPDYFLSSSVTRQGKEEIIAFIEKALNLATPKKQTR